MPQSATATEIETVPYQKVEHLPPKVVILWNSDVHTFDFVVGVLQEVCKMELEDAIKVAKEVHEKGKAAVWRGHLEICELKKDQIESLRDSDIIIQGGPDVPLGVTIADG